MGQVETHLGARSRLNALDNLGRRAPVRNVFFLLIRLAIKVSVDLFSSFYAIFCLYYLMFK